MGAAIAAGVVVSLAYRYWTGSRALRAPLTPALLISVVTGAASALGSVSGAHSTLRTWLTYAYLGGFCIWPLAFLVGAIMWRPRRAAITDLLIAVGNPAAVGDLRQLLATALRDPSLRLARWHPESGRYVDARDRPLDLETGADRTVVTLADHAGRPIGVLVRRMPPWEDTRLTDAVTTLVGLVLENQRLAAEAAARLAEVHASRARLVSLADEERRRMERDLHDGAQQRLVIAAVGIQLARQQLGSDGDPALVARLSTAAAEVAAAISQLRELARGIHPALLTDAGLTAAVTDLVERTPLPVTLRINALPRLPAPVEATAYFVIAEALTNIVKHARAERATVHLTVTEERLRLEIADDGAGGAVLIPESGLAGLRDRVRALDGELTVTAAAGSGTAVTADLPAG